jgi:acetoin utilization protein AcuB
MLTVEDIMTPDPCCVGPDTPLGEAVRLMKERHCRQLPVCDDEGRLLGVLSDRDVRLAVNSPFVLHERSDDAALLENIPVEACMTPDPLTIDADAPAALAADMLREYKFGALPVMRGGDLAGIVSVSDILRSYSQLLERLEEA